LFQEKNWIFSTVKNESEKTRFYAQKPQPKMPFKITISGQDEDSIKLALSTARKLKHT
jgi:hypothetical protein